MAGKTKSKPRVLVVDDEENLRMIVTMSTDALGLETVEAVDGAQALKILKSQTVDLVISDINMPNVNGLELLAKMRKGGVTTPVIFVTGYGTSENRADAQKLGVFGFIEKPYDVADFDALICKALAG